MAYDHQKFLVSTGLIAYDSTGVKFEYPVGLIPLKLRKAAAQITVAVTTPAAVVELNRRVTAGAATGEVVIDTITVPIATVNGKSYYVTDLNTIIYPGESLSVEVTTAAGAGDGHMQFEFEPVWDVPENQADMVLSA